MIFSKKSLETLCEKFGDFFGDAMWKVWRFPKKSLETILEMPVNTGVSSNRDFRDFWWYFYISKLLEIEINCNL